MRKRKAFELPLKNLYVVWTMGKKLRFLLFPVSCFLLLASSFSSAATFDPSADWMTIKTDHFLVHYPKDIEAAAKNTAGILEEVHANLSRKLDWKPWGRTEVILSDSTDDANGMTYMLPYNWMLLYITPPRPDSSLANYDDWLRTLITHEYTHLLHFDAERGFWKPFKLIFGKMIAPAGFAPGWVREGFAVYEETNQTTAGRGRAGYTDMMIRTAVLENNFPTIDLGDGVQWRWPSYNVSYLFGDKFISYLTDHYGEESFLKFIRRMQSSPLLSMVNHQARNVYHKTFYELWREWQDELGKNYGALKKELEERGITPLTPAVKAKQDEQYSAPVPSPDSKKLAYIASSPHRRTELRVMDLETGKEAVIAKQSATRLAWSPDGKKIVYSSMNSYKRYNYFSDLWLYNFETKKTKRLTKGVRARDPDFSPLGGEIIFVSAASEHDSLKILKTDTLEISTLVDENQDYTHFADPRYSPDGKTIALDVWKKGEGWKIYLYSPENGRFKRLSAGVGMETSPWWSQDGGHVYYASDENGISNVSDFNLAKRTSTVLTNVVTGVFDPATRDQEHFFVREYHSKGFGISVFFLPHKKKDVSKTQGTNKLSVGGSAVSPQTDPLEASADAALEAKKYSPFGQSLFLPRFLIPNVAYIQDAVLMNFMTGGNDPLRWHNWQAGGTYRTDAKAFGYFGSYWYNRWREVMGLGINDYAVDFGDLTFIHQDGTANTVRYFEERRNAYAFLALPVKRHRFGLNYFYEDRWAKTALTAAERSALNLGIFSGVAGSYIYGDAEIYPASISLENGRKIKLTGIVTDSALGSGSRNEQKILAGDWREYVRLWRHHVLGLRAAGGIAWGDSLVQGTFGLGGALGEGAFAGGGSYNYFPLRGLPVSALSRTRALLLSAEYRLPIVSPQRGIGTWPFFLNDIHAAFFADYGNAWNAHEDGDGGFKGFFDDFFLGVGSELRGNFVVGHGLPLMGRLGYGIIVANRDRLGTLKDPLLDTSLKNGMLILQLGTSF